MDVVAPHIRKALFTDLFAVDSEIGQVQIPLNLGITLNTSALGAPVPANEARIVSELLRLLREINGVYHSDNIGFFTNEFGSVISDEETKFEVKGSVKLTSGH